MISLSKSMLKAKMLEYFRMIEKSGDTIIVTDNRRPVIKIVPIRAKVPPAVVFEKRRGGVRYSEDILADTSGEWGDI